MTFAATSASHWRRTPPDAGNCLCPHEWELTQFDCITPHVTPGCTDTRLRRPRLRGRSQLLLGGLGLDVRRARQAALPEPCTNLRLQTEVCVIDPACCEPTLIDGELVGSWDDGLRCRLCRPRDLPAARTADQGFGGERSCSANPPRDEEGPGPPGPARLRPAASLHRGQRLLPPAGTPRFNSEISECLAVLTQNYPGCGRCSPPATGTRPASRSPIGSAGSPNRSPWASATACVRTPAAAAPTATAPSWSARSIQPAAGRNGTRGALTSPPPSACSFPPTCWDSPTSRRSALSVEDDEGLYRCGSPATGSCCYQSFTPFCRNEACCQIVCGYDDYCCEVRWDEALPRWRRPPATPWPSSAPAARSLIEFGSLNRSCFEGRDPDAQYITGCNDAECCNAVCFIDPFCCEVIWDDLCGEGALEVCSPFEDIFPGCGDILAGSCFVPSETPYCDDIACCQNVCARSTPRAASPPGTPTASRSPRSSAPSAATPSPGLPLADRDTGLRRRGVLRVGVRDRSLLLPGHLGLLLRLPRTKLHRVQADGELRRPLRPELLPHLELPRLLGRHLLRRDLP